MSSTVELMAVPLSESDAIAPAPALDYPEPLIIANAYTDADAFTVRRRPIRDLDSAAVHAHMGWL
jgi:hypothetical protein